MPTIKFKLDNSKYCTGTSNGIIDTDCFCLIDDYCRYFDKELALKKVGKKYHLKRLPECIKELGE